jgi:hypothetical protein
MAGDPGSILTSRRGHRSQPQSPEDCVSHSRGWRVEGGGSGGNFRELPPTSSQPSFYGMSFHNSTIEKRERMDRIGGGGSQF